MIASSYHCSYTGRASAATWALGLSPSLLFLLTAILPVPFQKCQVRYYLLFLDDETSTVKKIMMVIGDEVRSSLTRTPTFQVGPKQARHDLTANEEIFYLTIVGGAHKIFDLHSSTTNFGTLRKKTPEVLHHHRRKGI
ncbi:unnamed protein product [Polarella glacialis]|uniref:Uncharacterized protein n=1 Tax=Polarella glacialis TaxID=89957 RepID=A0A813IQH6_POLGL|nr:unnamed protein product [Polarella glacialis]